MFLTDIRKLTKFNKKNILSVFDVVCLKCVIIIFN